MTADAACIGPAIGQRSFKQNGDRMNKKSAAALTVWAALLVAPASSLAITNGNLDGGAHPNVGALTVQDSTGAQVLACTGTLISPTVLVTAAHCTAQLQQLGYSQTSVSFDTNIGSGSDITCDLTDCYVQPAAKSLYVGTLHTHPLFNGSTEGTDSHDVGVVTFDKAVKGITPASLPPAGLLDGMASNGTLAAQTFTDVGYGWHAVVSSTNASNFTGLFDGQRRNATSGSQSLSTSDLRLNESPTLGFGGACSHDSGGPAFVGSGGVVAGEVSGLQGGGCDTTYYVYRLDTASARSFLANYVTLP
jgi:hypothetical protein